MASREKAAIEVVLQTGAAERSLENLTRDRQSSVGGGGGGGGFGAGRTLSGAGRGGAGGGSSGGGLGAGRAIAMRGGSGAMSGIGLGLAAGAASLVGAAAVTAGGKAIEGGRTIIGNEIDKFQSWVLSSTPQGFQESINTARAEGDARQRTLEWTRSTYGAADEDMIREMLNVNTMLAEQRYSLDDEFNKIAGEGSKTKQATDSALESLAEIGLELAGEMRSLLDWLKKGIGSLVSRF
jgi:hypothetical protein